MMALSTGTALNPPPGGTITSAASGPGLPVAALHYRSFAADAEKRGETEATCGLPVIIAIRREVDDARSVLRGDEFSGNDAVRLLRTLLGPIGGMEIGLGKQLEEPPVPAPDQLAPGNAFH